MKQGTTGDLQTPNNHSKHALLNTTKLCITLLSVIALSFAPVLTKAQEVLTLDECYRRALDANKGLKQAEAKVAETQALKQAALAEFFPKVSASGAYLWNQKDIHLLSNDAEYRLQNMGTTVLNDLSGLNQFTQALSTLFPALAQQIEQSLGLDNLATNLNNLGSEIVQATELDIQNVFAGGITISQPIYLGGKLRALHRSAAIYNDIAALELAKAQDDLLTEVDEAYWRVISLQSKVAVAKQYCELLAHLDSNVNIMMEAEVATKSDVTKVRVKLNEAQMTLTKAENGLILSKMLLYQICGMNLNSNYNFAEDTALVSYSPLQEFDMESIWQNRTEIQMLNNAQELANTSVRLATSTVLPNVVAQGSYIVSNPNGFNGFENKFAGMFSAGVAVNIPLVNASRLYGIKAAKRKRDAAQYKLDEAKEKIELQVNKLNFELEVALKKMTQAQSNLANAEENLAMATESFEAGVISSSDLLAAQTAWLSAKTEVIDANIEIIMCHRYLMQAIGKNTSK